MWETNTPLKVEVSEPKSLEKNCACGALTQSAMKGVQSPAVPAPEDLLWDLEALALRPWCVGTSGSEWGPQGWFWEYGRKLKTEPAAATMAKDIIQVTLTGTTNKIRKMKVPSSFLQSSLVPILPEPIKEPAGKKTCCQVKNLSQVSIT